VTESVFSGLYAAGPDPVRSVPIFMVGVVSLGSIIAVARLATGTIWPAILLHGAWNTIIQGVFDRATSGPAALIWTGESGLLTAATLVVTASLIALRPWPMLRWPGKSMESARPRDTT